MTRIRSDNIQLGESFIVPTEQGEHNKKIQQALEKEKEIILQGEQKAQEIIEQAQQQARQQAQDIVESARNQALSEVEAITQKAHDEGFEAGRQEGLEDITRELQDKVCSVNDFAQSNFNIKNNIVKSAYLDIVSLVIEIAHKVCSKSLELDEKILKEITEHAIQALKDKEEITIIVNPKMAEKIYAISDELKEKIPQLSSIKIVEDSSVSPDGTIVESPMSRVDCRVKSQIDEIANKLMDKYNSTGAEEIKDEKTETKIEEAPVETEEIEAEEELIQEEQDP